MFFVYIIKSSNKNYYYVGSTENLQKRLKQHNNGEVRSTGFRRPYNIVYTEIYTTANEARLREKQIKKSRFEKQRIIDNIMASSSNG